MTWRTRFRDRVDAGEQLAGHLREYAHEASIVLGIPRGGVPVAARVARHLGAPLDVCIVRRLHAAGPLRLGIGAVAEGGAVFLDRRMLHLTGPRNAEVAQQIRRERIKVAELAERLRDGQPPPCLKDLTVILVDDGIAIGETVQAALRCLRRQQPRRRRAARAAKRGVWAVSAVIKNAESPGDILAGIGRFTVVEGKVLSVRQAGATTYLNFGRNWTRDFAVTISRRTIPALEAAGLAPKSLESKRIRVRGFIDSRGGPRIELLRAGQVEVLGGN